MMVTFTRFDAADYLKDMEDMTANLDAVAEANNPALTIAALNTAARARNMSQLARDAGMTREGIYKALSPDGNPSAAAE